MAGQMAAQTGAARRGPDLEFASHEVRLSGRQWVVAAAILLAAFVLMPTLWEGVEELAGRPDYRMPYALSADYWLFSRYCRRAASRDRTVALGDSVVWAQYVREDETLTHYLNELAGEDRFVNMGLDGAHPAALAGLIEHYARSVSGGNVVLHCNPLWMSSGKHDLSTPEEFRFNHPRLVPQFFPRVSCYRESCAGRLGVVIEREVPFLAWANHLRMAFFDQKDIPSWTLEHPYRNPLGALSRQVPEASAKPQHEQSSWLQRGISPQDFAWVGLDESFQWRSFQRALHLLRDRGCNVFVLVGPFNEHMLKPASLERYEQIKGGIAAWLGSQGVACYVPPALPSQLYADASHPLKEGYALLARQLHENDAFIRFNAR